MLQWGYDYDGVAAVRYPRGSGPEKIAHNGGRIAKGKAKVLRTGKKVAILAFGAMVARCESIAQEIDATLVNMRFVKPLDDALLQKLGRDHDIFITVEENALMGGAGSAVNECVVQHAIDVQLHNIGLPDVFVQHGSRDEILSDAGLSEERISKQIKTILQW